MRLQISSSGILLISSHTDGSYNLFANRRKIFIENIFEAVLAMCSMYTISDMGNELPLPYFRPDSIEYIREAAHAACLHRFYVRHV